MPDTHRALATLDLLRGFEAAARHLSFTGAAADLNVTQSAVSRQIQSLEERIGVALFERHPRKLVLTQAGQLLYRTANTVLDQLNNTLNAITQREQEHIVTVTCTISFASLWLIPRLPEFRKLHPEVNVRIAADNRVLDLQRERIDLGIRFSPAQLAPPDALKLFGEELFPVCSPALLRDASRPLVNVKDLSKQVLLHLQEEPGVAPWINWTVWLEPYGLQNLKPAGSLHFSHYDQVIQAAVDGQGVALGRTHLVKNLISARKLIAPFKLTANTQRGYFAFYATSQPRHEDTVKFMKWLADAARREEQSTDGKRTAKRVKKAVAT
jgi:LysR family glycine cleavage system transcriptional activator